MGKAEEAAARALLMGGVGGASFQQRYPGGVSGASFAPRYPGGVGAPAVQVESLEERPYQYTSERYRSGEVTYLGFGATVIPASSVDGGEVTVEINTKRPFSPQQLRIPSTLTGVLITEANIEGTNLFANSAGVPVELMSEVSTTPPIDWFEIQPATGAELQLKNIEDEEKVFTGAFWGTALRK